MTKKIGGFYNGGTKSFRYCDNPVEAGLEEGKFYAFYSQKDVDGFQTNVTLYEFPNKEFNSVWFEERKLPKTYIAYSTTLPIRGFKYHCNRMETMDNGQVCFNPVTTSIVEDIVQIGPRTIAVKTQNSMYITEIHEK